MKMTELANNGVYAAVRPTPESIQKIYEYLKQRNIPNAVAPEKLHVTLISSEQPMPGFIPDPSIRHVATPISFTFFNTKPPSADMTPWRALVLRLACNTLSQRHLQLHQQFGGNYRYGGKFEPHMTWSYNIENMDPSDISWLPRPDFEIILTGEYAEQLNLNWAAEHGVKK